MKIKFGTDGWRGLIDDDFTFDNVAHVIQAYAQVLLQHNQKPGALYVGYDRRRKSPEFANVVAEVLTAHGFNVHLSSDFCPTPCISWLTKSNKAQGGVVVTASHNPSSWNGIKFKEPYGGSASPEFCQSVEELCDQNRTQEITPKKITLTEAKSQDLLHTFDPQKEYCQQLARMVDLDSLRKAGLKIIVDPMYGAGGGFFAQVLQTPLQELHAAADPNFGGTQPEPIAQNLTELMKTIAEGDFDIGLATDGDADRIGAVDEKGRFVDSHHIYALMLQHLVTHRGLKGDVVKTVTTTNMIDKLTEKYNLPVHVTPVGFKHICQKFQETTPLIGGEESGGIAIPEHVQERDGILSGLMLLEIMTVNKKPLSQLIEDLHQDIGLHYFVRNDLHLNDEQIETARQIILKTEERAIAGHTVKTINKTDGSRYEFDDGCWLLLRASGTEPLVRVYAEAPTREAAQELITAGRNLLV